MPDYTEAAIHTLDGRELRVAVEQVVFDDDLTANTDTRIAEAVKDWAGHKTIFGSYWFSSHPGLVWKYRRSKQYQDDLEQHVAAYRVEPREMDLSWCWKRLMRECWELVQMRDRIRCRSIVDDVEAFGDDPATAIKRAACIVALRKRSKANETHTTRQ